MSFESFSLTYGAEKRSFSVPKAKLAGPLIAPRENQALPGELSEILARALAHPNGPHLLRELAFQRKVGLVISDEFRAGLQHEILDALLNEIAIGHPSSVRVLVATGTHRPAVYAKAAAGWVESASRRLGMPIDYVPNDSENGTFVSLGHTRRKTEVRVNQKLLECDLRVYGHESKHHYLNGYSCVDKQVLPGCSCSLTVKQNHKWALDPLSGPGRSPWCADPDRNSNPFAEDAREARELSERFFLNTAGKLEEIEIATFCLDMVSSAKKIFWVRTGDPAEVCREMVAVVDDLAAFRVPRSKYVILSPGGPPASQALYGTQNCFDLALKGAILPGGEALILAPLDGRADLPPEVSGLAPDERSKKLFWDNLTRLIAQPLEEARKEIYHRFELYLWKTDRVLRQLKGDGINIYLYSTLSETLLRQGGFKAAPDLQAWIDQRVALDDGLFNVIENGNKLFVQPKA